MNNFVEEKPDNHEKIGTTIVGYFLYVYGFVSTIRKLCGVKS